ncbi:uncharacterized protein CYBJADRAFT_166386 [Cyberlindnera jadinii NRRL Y-1542]|uniref:Uncharacterized protein n=1 Tax=Cyberlindnera jadinii (strain ATCC 18201 / CBS 1600 / BCRC 20928 / JCM 3617 / NBRC 0987 / NRRL Y-1542) TaxID=983966 RepID=A0A1E4RYA1_CYBJN|nr:hypothetical protein CYBJADRAFT_168907 [Cyberlindnera jadinii NRRL Y-1542]XP_020071617.1 hypothetical protein CYBJADRAFT_166386 [Cyberlindnera jadinii NRRL Y-1542]ODV72244.1 hypothetical protein CYBJADRAFT_168907 [Cyberlindnera jadinii NRRL Y-1542]ODV74578.1 hypothetical protein CYBJADRAFT_166386 [Cyberlindnera jadinii NRRL Y-1542]
MISSYIELKPQLQLIHTRSTNHSKGSPPPKDATVIYATPLCMSPWWRHQLYERASTTGM